MPNEQHELTRPATLAIGQHLAMYNSYRRTHELWLAMVLARMPRDQIALFLEWGNACDAPWAYRGEFAGILREAVKEVPLREVLPAPERAWFDSMSPLVRVHRGCEAGRVRGLSWTTDPIVARRFAAGQRCVNTHPMLASAVIPRQHILALFFDRKEYEVVVDPRRLRQLSSEPLQQRYYWDYFSDLAATDAA